MSQKTVVFKNSINLTVRIDHDMKDSLKNILLIPRKTKIMNTLNTATQGFTSPISRDKNSFDYQSQVSPPLDMGFLVVLITLIGIPCFTSVIHNLKQGSVTFKLEINRWIKTEFTIMKKK